MQMDRCRCHDIQVIQRDLRKLGNMPSKLTRVDRALEKTDNATQNLKSAVQGAVEVSLGGVPSDIFSKSCRSAKTAAANSVSRRQGELEAQLSAYRAEDTRYHERLRYEAMMRERARREAIQKEAARRAAAEGLRGQ